MTVTAVETFQLRAPLPAGGVATPPDDFVLLPGHREHALRVERALPAALKDAFWLLEFNMLSALLVKGAFASNDDGRTPAGFTGSEADPTWWSAANTAASLASARGIQPCSYHCENAGRLFVHLTPGRGDDPSAAKSRAALSGHTDASALPFPDEACGYDAVAPSPDLVILVGIRNPANVVTRIAPLSTIHRALDEDSISLLKRPIFDFSPQASFEMDPGYVNRGKPVLTHDRIDGLLIRFSHSKVTTAVPEGQVALAKLKTAIAASFEDVALAPGDVLFVNNRTALHGRSPAATAGASAPRWLLRCYGMHARRPEFAFDAARPYLLLPASGGPPAADPPA